MHTFSRNCPPPPPPEDFVCNNIRGHVHKDSQIMNPCTPVGANTRYVYTVNTTISLSTVNLNFVIVLGCICYMEYDYAVCFSCLFTSNICYMLQEPNPIIGNHDLAFYPVFLSLFPSECHVSSCLGYLHPKWCQLCVRSQAATRHWRGIHSLSISEMFSLGPASTFSYSVWWIFRLWPEISLYNHWLIIIFSAFDFESHDL